MSNLLEELMGFIGGEYLEYSTNELEQNSMLMEIAEKRIAPDFDHITVI